MLCFIRGDMEIVLTTGCNMKIKYGMHWAHLVTASASHMQTLRGFNQNYSIEKKESDHLPVACIHCTRINYTTQIGSKRCTHSPPYFSRSGCIDFCMPSNLIFTAQWLASEWASEDEKWNECKRKMEIFDWIEAPGNYTHDWHRDRDTDINKNMK